MSLKRILYSLLVVVVAGTSALFGAVAGGVSVYRAVVAQPGNFPRRCRKCFQQIVPAPARRWCSITRISRPRSHNRFKRLDQRLSP